MFYTIIEKLDKAMNFSVVSAYSNIARHIIIPKQSTGFLNGLVRMITFGIHFCKVRGVSMSPQIPEHSYICIVPWLKMLPIKEGCTVKVFHPNYGYIVKTLAKIDRNGLFWLKGCHKSSIPIEKLGPVGKSQILGKVFMVFPPN